MITLIAVLIATGSGVLTEYLITNNFLFSCIEWVFTQWFEAYKLVSMNEQINNHGEPMYKAILFLFVSLYCQLGLAQTEAVHNIAEFTFESGKKLQNMKVGYVTHGTLNANKSNAILITHGTSGNRLGYNIYIGPIKRLIPISTLSSQWMRLVAALQHRHKAQGWVLISRDTPSATW